MDLRLEEKLEQVQFVYFMHCVASRRRGSVIPVGLPLHIKEEILSKKVRYILMDPVSKASLSV